MQKGFFLRQKIIREHFNSDRLRKWNAYFYTQKSSLCLQTAFLEVHFVSLDAFCHLEEMTKFQIVHGYI